MEEPGLCDMFTWTSGVEAHRWCGGVVCGQFSFLDAGRYFGSGVLFSSGSMNHDLTIFVVKMPMELIHISL